MIDFEYPDQESEIDGLANLQSDAEVQLEHGRVRLRTAKQDVKTIYGATAQKAAKAQPDLQRRRFEHRHRRCWRCESTDVGFDHMRQRWSCSRDWRS